MFPSGIRIFLLIVSVSLTSCFYLKREDAIDDGVQRSYFQDGKIHKEISLKGGVMTGTYREYFHSGQLFREVNFINNKREGLEQKFYETGVHYEEVPYVNGRIHGNYKKYRRTGELMSEIPYYEGNLCAGLKEYTVEGKLKTHYPFVVINAIDNLKDNRYTLEIRMSDERRGGVEYFRGQLTGEKYLGGQAIQLLNVDHGVARLEFEVVPGTFVMEQIHFIAKVKTEQSNYLLVEATYNLAVVNRY